MIDEEQYVPLSLPSKGLIYEGVNINDIMIRPFKGRDEELVAELTLENVKKKFVTIIKNVIQGIEPEKLTAGDAKYIMLWEAINSYTQDYPIKIICENCLQEIQVVVDLSKINSVELPDDFKQPFDIQLSNKIVRLRLLTLADEVAIFDWTRTGKSAYLCSYARSIVDESTTLIDKIKMLEDMNTRDLNAIKNFHKKYDHGPDMEVPYTCSLCDYGGKIVLPFRLDRLLSFRE
ncbi:MAG: hypothetical protein ACTSU7_15105 [Candidatus Heimdallarchaeaceae archaeon]